MSSSIRNAETADVERLVAFARSVYVAAFGHTFVPDDLGPFLDATLSPAEVTGWIAEDVVLLAEDGGELIGFAHAGAPPAGVFGGHAKAGDFALYRLYVAGGRRARGLGQALMDRALSHAPAGADVWLDVWEENFGAQRLYERNGFRTVGRVKVETQSGAGAGFDFVMVRRRSR